MENKTLITVLGWEDRFINGTDIILTENNIQRGSANLFHRLCRYECRKINLNFYKKLIN